MACECDGCTHRFERCRAGSTPARATVATILTYLIEYETSGGDLREAEVDVDYNDMVASAHHDALDETARRYLIATILAEGGRVIKIRKMDGTRHN